MEESKEIWKEIEGYEGRYLVSSHDRIKSLIGTPKIRKSALIGRGYHQLTLHKNGDKKPFLVHRLVAEAFIPNPKDKPMVNHRDGNKTNNHVSNLEWVTHSENFEHAAEIGLIPSGEDHWQVKINTETARKIKKKIDNTDLTQQEIADMFGVTQTTVSKINTNIHPLIAK